MHRRSRAQAAAIIASIVRIEKNREPRLQLNDEEPFEIDSCEVVRDLDHSTLTNVVRTGKHVAFTPGDRVTVYAGPSVVFMGKAIDADSVLDLISTESDEELEDYESI
jgi:transcription elongation factor